MSWSIKRVSLRKRDPAIQKSWRHFEALLKQLPDDTAIHIEEAYSDLEGAVTSVAILYGMRVMWTMHEAMKSPAEMSQFLLDLSEGCGNVNTA